MALCWLISVVELTTVTDGDGDGSDYDGGLKISIFENDARNDEG